MPTAAPTAPISSSSEETAAFTVYRNSQRSVSGELRSTQSVVAVQRRSMLSPRWLLLHASAYMAPMRGAGYLAPPICEWPLLLSDVSRSGSQAGDLGNSSAVLPLGDVARTTAW
eukprot:COSAG02_NODE_6132_length_3778_cov_194.586794_4_plen_114_part_00